MAIEGILSNRDALLSSDICYRGAPRPHSRLEMLSGDLLIALVAAANVALLSALSAQNGTSLSPAMPAIVGDMCASFSGCCQCEDEITDEGADESITIRVLSAGGETFRHIYEMIETGARSFEAEMDGRVSIIVEELANLNQLADEVRNNAMLDVAYFDGFVSNPGVVGSAVTSGGFMDLSEFVRESLDLDWLDILPAFRDSVLVYDGKPYMFPLDGDVHSLFYRRDVLDHFNLSVPRTWDEYVEVAKSTHGQTFNGTRLDGSCVGRANSSVGQYYANLVLSSYSQALGTKSGFLFDVEDMTPLAGEALAETIRQLEEQNMYGSEDGEFQKTFAKPKLGLGLSFRAPRPLFYTKSWRPLAVARMLPRTSRGSSPTAHVF